MNKEEKIMGDLLWGSIKSYGGNVLSNTVTQVGTEGAKNAGSFAAHKTGEFLYNITIAPTPTNLVAIRNTVLTNQALEVAETMLQTPYGDALGYTLNYIVSPGGFATIVGIAGTVVSIYVGTQMLRHNQKNEKREERRSSEEKEKKLVEIFMEDPTIPEFMRIKDTKRFHTLLLEYEENVHNGSRQEGRLSPQEKKAFEHILAIHQRFPGYYTRKSKEIEKTHFNTMGERQEALKRIDPFSRLKGINFGRFGKVLVTVPDILGTDKIGPQEYIDRFERDPHYPQIDLSKDPALKNMLLSFYSPYSKRNVNNPREFGPWLKQLRSLRRKVEITQHEEEVLLTQAKKNQARQENKIKSLESAIESFNKEIEIYNLLTEPAKVEMRNRRGIRDKAEKVRILATQLEELSSAGEKIDASIDRKAREVVRTYIFLANPSASLNRLEHLQKEHIGRLSHEKTRRIIEEGRSLHPPPRKQNQISPDQAWLLTVALASINSPKKRGREEETEAGLTRKIRKLGETFQVKEITNYLVNGALDAAKSVKGTAKQIISGEIKRARKVYLEKRQEAINHVVEFEKKLTRGKKRVRSFFNEGVEEEEEEEEEGHQVKFTKFPPHITGESQIVVHLPQPVLVLPAPPAPPPEEKKKSRKRPRSREIESSLVRNQVIPQRARKKRKRD